MKFLFPVILVFIVAIEAVAQPLVPKGSFVLNLDYSRFRYTQHEGYLEVSFGIYPSLLTLKRDQGQFKGEVDVLTVIREKRTDSVVVAQRASIPIILTDTSAGSLNRWFVSKLMFAIPFGEFTMDVHSQDASRPTRGDSGHVSFRIDSLTSRPALSDVDLCTSITESDKKESPFYKNTFEVIPNPSLFFGSAGAPVIFSYAEIYNLEIGRAYTVTTAVIDGRGQIVKSRVRTRTFNVRDAVDVSTLPVTTISSGKFLFRLSLTDSTGAEAARTEKPVFIYNPGVQPVSSGTVSAGAAALAGMTNDELVAEFRRARYIASSEQTRMFERLSTDDGRREFMAKFWDQVEAMGTDGRTRMTRGDYLHRLTVANERYGSLGHEGWVTDRGRVYCLNGEPDDIERFPSQGDSKPYEVWHYYSIENGVEYDFVDRAGLGDYVLVNSTKRGEIQDASWQRYLQ